MLLLLALPLAAQPARAETVVLHGKPYGGIFVHGTVSLNERGIHTETHAIFRSRTHTYAYTDIKDVQNDYGLFRGHVRLSMIAGGVTDLYMPRYASRELETLVSQRIMKGG